MEPTCFKKLYFKVFGLQNMWVSYYLQFIVQLMSHLFRKVSDTSILCNYARRSQNLRAIWIKKQTLQCFVERSKYLFYAFIPITG